ncbi:hypothetical protein L1887_23438 [Cichorium endivia]|nr:hypothetical protein L1887_23438 [Cichorium endivia]
MVLSSFPLILRLPHSSSVFACVFADRRERETDRAVRDRRNQRKEGRVGKQSEKKRDVAEVCKTACSCTVSNSPLPSISYCLSECFIALHVRSKTSATPLLISPTFAIVIPLPTSQRFPDAVNRRNIPSQIEE